MMSGHGGNPIFFDKKIKVGRPEHSLIPHLPTSDNISFLPFGRVANGRVATSKLMLRNCLRYLQTTLIMGGGGLVSEFM